MSYVYILQIIIDIRYYIGITTDLSKRLYHHINGYTTSTKRFSKEKLVFSQEYDTFKEARYVESKLKKTMRKDYIEKIIEDGYIKIKSS